MTIGECHLRRTTNNLTLTDELWIDRADPHVLITEEIIDWAIYQPNDRLWMDFSDEQTCFEDHEHDRATCFRLRSVLHIKGVNREVLYRVSVHPDRPNLFEGRWPD